MNVQELEIASRIAWPALEEIELEGGVLRYACGVSRHSNAMIPSASGQFCPRTLISETERFYGAKGQAAVVKVLTKKNSPTDFANLDSLLVQGKYEKEAPTAVLGLNLNDFNSVIKPAVEFQMSKCSRSEWVKSWHAVRKFDRLHLSTHSQLLERISGDVSCLVLSDQVGKPCATGMAVRHANTLGIFGMATDSNYQGQGLASSVLGSLLNWGKKRTAEFAYLQVEVCNEPAQSLYNKFGFSPQYSYWYRVKDVAGAI
ncbi:MAG: GNAT family N-acetyltransferase [Pseudomonadales bacterium]|nr:GNAT family N-acetyltransferase [Pseudomonadales bacterium]